MPKIGSFIWPLPIDLNKWYAIAMQNIDRTLHQIKALDETQMSLVAYLYVQKKGKKAKS